MAKVNSSTSTCRVMVMAGKNLRNPSPGLGPSTCHRLMLKHQRRLASSKAAGQGGKIPVFGAFSASDRYVLSNCTLIYRDVKAFLKEISGVPWEARERYWLTQFQRASLAQVSAFAVLEVDKSVFENREMVQSLAFGLSFLQRMDMKPVVVMGLSRPEDGNAPDGSTSNSRADIVQQCQTNSGPTAPLSQCHAFSAEALLLVQDPPQGSSAGSSIAMDKGLLQWSLDCGAIPQVCPVGRDTTGRSVTLDSVDVTAAISKVLQPLKVMSLNSWDFCNLFQSLAAENWKERRPKEELALGVTSEIYLLERLLRVGGALPSKDL
uniref:N-acetylglutamate synthase n=1 Tax=Salmo trutta TaxID=8032 RepID=A0A674DMR5_SALTR